MNLSSIGPTGAGLPSVSNRDNSTPKLELELGTRLELELELELGTRLELELEMDLGTKLEMELFLGVIGDVPVSVKLAICVPKLLVSTPLPVGTQAFDPSLSSSVSSSSSSSSLLLPIGTKAFEPRGGPPRGGGPPGGGGVGALLVIVFIPA